MIFYCLVINLQLAEDVILKRLLLVLSMALLLTGCASKDPALTKFQNDMEAFSQNVETIHTKINNFSTTVNADNVDDLKRDFLYQLDSLDEQFKKFATFEFPEDFAYLEKTADEASEYMTEAVTSFHTLYEEFYSENLASYAQENYERAWKRVKIIISLIHGETPEGDGLIIQ